MENALLIAVAVLPLGLVALSAYLMYKRRNKKKVVPLTLVSNKSIKKVQSLSSRMRQLNSEAQCDEDADVSSPVVKAPAKKKAKKKNRRGKRK